MSIDVSPEIGARLLDEAHRQGVSLEDLLERLIAAGTAGERKASVEPPHAIPELPVLHLGVMGPLHRRDIYDDVR